MSGHGIIRVYYLVKFIEHLEAVDLCILPHSGSSQSLFLPIIRPPTNLFFLHNTLSFLLLGLWWHECLNFFVLSHRYLKLPTDSFFQIFFPPLCCSNCTTSIHILLHSLTLSSVTSILLLSPFNEFFLFEISHLALLSIFCSFAEIFFLFVAITCTLTWRRNFIIATLEPQPDNPTICVVSVLASAPCPLEVEIFLVLYVPSDFGLYIRHFDKYVMRLWVLFKICGVVGIFF